ncbi:MAG TPA: ribosome small subunit-dependent GTPase A [Candidatus Xenobia bacterium]
MQSLGYIGFFAQAFQELSIEGTPGRVVSDHGGAYLVDEQLTTVSGRLRHAGTQPVVGDWVVVRDTIIQAVLPRRTELRRAAAGRRTEVQVLAANVDTAFVVMGLDDNFNLRRLDRFLTLAQGGIQPVVVLNKTDVSAEGESRQALVRQLHPTAPCGRISAVTGDGLDFLVPWLAPAQTVAVIGSSGVGKSTLINRLLGEDRLRTQAVRATDAHGRHTTTHRELLTLPGGALLIDTPGLREVQLWDDAGLDDAFSTVTNLSQACRFRDCRHDKEPGCAVRGQVADDELRTFHKLRRELRHQASRQDGRIRLEEKRPVRLIHRAQQRKYRGEP